MKLFFRFGSPLSMSKVIILVGLSWGSSIGGEGDLRLAFGEDVEMDGEART